MAPSSKTGIGAGASAVTAGELGWGGRPRVVEDVEAVPGRFFDAGAFASADSLDAAAGRGDRYVLCSLAGKARAMLVAALFSATGIAYMASTAHPELQDKAATAAVTTRPRRRIVSAAAGRALRKLDNCEDCKTSLQLSGGINRLPMFTILPGSTKRKIWGVEGKSLCTV
jgi:hypothetical protein